MITIFAFIAFGAYCIAALSLMGRFFHRQGPNKNVSLLIAGLAVISHGVFLYDAIVANTGQNMSITNVLSLVSWLITLSMMLGSSILANVIMLPVVFGFAALTVLLSLSLPVEHIMHIELQPGLVVHITLSLFAYGALVIAFLYALQMSFIAYQLKKKGAAILHSSLPPLMLVEGILFKLLLVGTVLLVVSLLSGFIFLEDMLEKRYAHKTVLSIAALLVYIILLTGQKLWGWRGKQVIILTVLGVVLLSLAYFGSRFVREILL